MNAPLLRALSGFRQIDSRWIALITVVLLAVPMFVSVPLKMVAFPATRAMKKAIDDLPPDAIIVLSTDWDSGTRGECMPQTAAVIDYLFKTNRRFGIIGFIPQGPELAQDLCDELARKHGKTYGKDWINWGYRPNYVATIIAMMNDIPGTLKNDIRGDSRVKEPLTQELKTLKRAGLLIEITGTRLYGVFLQFAAGVPLAFGCTGVSGPDMYPYLQSGQAKGLLVGLGGAAQFEDITDSHDAQGNRGGQGTRGMGSQSLGHLLVMVLIVMGNLGVWAQRRLDDQPPGSLPPSTPADGAPAGDEEVTS